MPCAPLERVAAMLAYSTGKLHFLVSEQLMALTSVEKVSGRQFVQMLRRSHSPHGSQPGGLG